MTGEPRIYYATADRDGQFWHIRVPEVDRATQARTLDEIEPMTRDLIAIMAEIPADSFCLRVTVEYPAGDEAAP